MLPIIENRALVVSRYRRADSEDSPISVDDESLSDHEVGFYGGANGLFSLLSKIIVPICLCRPTIRS